MRRLVLQFIVILTGFSAPALATAEGLTIRAGVIVGGNFGTLSAPQDAVGEPTLLSGAAFSGPGFVAGLSASTPVYSLTTNTQLTLELDLLASVLNANGKAESPSTDQRREVELTSTVLRAPFLVGVEHSFSSGFGLNVVAGPELLLGLGSGSTITEENVDGAPVPLYTTPVTHVGLTAGIGAIIPLGERLRIPVTFRFTWDPAVPTTTRERFDNFQSDSEPGSYQVALDYQYALLLGLEYLFAFDDP